jgi:hypothetical protein
MVSNVGWCTSMIKTQLRSFQVTWTMLDTRTNAQKEDWFLRLNPNGKFAIPRQASVPIDAWMKAGFL